MNKYFSAGIATLLPLFITLTVVNLIVEMLTFPFLEPMQTFIDYLDCLPNEGLCQRPLLTELISRGLILLGLAALVMGIGRLGHLFLVRYFLHLSDLFFRHIPVINKIYRASQEVIQTAFSSSDTLFSQVVLVPYPHEGNLSIGLVAALKTVPLAPPLPEGLLPVFVPSALNPTYGWVLLFRQAQLTFTDLTIEEAMKLVLSCGVASKRDEAERGQQTEGHPHPVP